MRRPLAALSISLAFTACSGNDAGLPARYRRMAVPLERLRSAEARERGRVLFTAHCALCHGERGDGRGLRAAGFARSPANLTDSSWRRRATARRVFFVIREGVRGTPMPGWPSFEDGEAWDVVAYVLSLGPP